MSEIWKPVSDYEGIYEVSNEGNIRGVDRIVIYKNKKVYHLKGKIIKQGKIWSVYKKIILSKNGIKKTLSVSRIVLKSFHNRVDQEYLQVNHKNGIRDDNHIDNLEWCTASENSKHSFRILKRKPTRAWAGIIGANHPNSIPIIQKDLNDNVINAFDSSASAARDLGLNEDTISRASRKERKTAYGYKWERLSTCQM